MQRKAIDRRWRGLALILAGVMIGGVLIGPVSAAVSFSREDRKFIRKTARKIANKRKQKVLNQLQPQIDGKQDACEKGSVLASALVKGSAAFPAAFTSSTASPALFGPTHNCGSPTNEVKALRVQTGIFEVALPGLGTRPDNLGEYVAHVTVYHDLAGFPDAHTASYLTRADGTEGDVLRVRLQDVTPGDDGPADEWFSVTVYSYKTA